MATDEPKEGMDDDETFGEVTAMVAMHGMLAASNHREDVVNDDELFERAYRLADKNIAARAAWRERRKAAAAKRMPAPPA